MHTLQKDPTDRLIQTLARGSALRVLRLLASGPRRFTDVATELARGRRPDNKGTASALRDLRRAGLVTRDPERPRKPRRYHLTDRGEGLVEQLRSIDELTGARRDR